MRVGPLKVVRIIARLNVGGPARHCLLLGHALASRGFEQVLATGDLDEGEASVLDRDPALGQGLRIEKIPGLGRRISARDDARALSALVRLLRRERPDVVHTHTAKAGALGRVAAKLTGVPVVVHTFHGHVLSGYFGRVGSWLARTAERGLALFADRLVCLSELQRDELSRKFRVAPPDKFTIVPLGRDLARLAAAPRGKLRRELGLDDATPLLAYVGRLVAIKDPATLLRALAKTQGDAARAVLVMAGQGPLEEDVRRLARELGIESRVRLLGWRDDLDAILGDATALVLSSRNEGTPLAIVEAFAAGTPVVSTAVGGVSDMLDRSGGALATSSELTRARVVEHGLDLRAQGVLVPAGDEDRLARAIECVVADEGLRRGAQEAGRAAAARYDKERLADDVARLYRELAARKLPRRELAPVAREVTS